MRLRLRWKILAFTVLPLVTLAFATLWTVNRSITRHMQQALHEDLRRAASVLENLLATRAQSLALAGQMTAQDPKFFSVLTLPGSYRDAEVRATVTGVARDFNAIAEADLFEVLDAEGNVVGVVGRDVTQAAARAPLVREALAGRPVSAILVQPDAHYQVSVTPVIAGRRVVGALLLGVRIGGELAQRLKELTRSEVTFVSGRSSTGSTLDSEADRAATLAATEQLVRRAAAAERGGTLLDVRGQVHRYLTLVHPLPLSDREQGQFFVMQRALDSETVFLRETQMELIGLGLIAAFVALLAGVGIAERITSPVQRLVRGAEEMERGNYDFPLAVRSRDEIGELAARFEEMRHRQREYVHNLEDAARIKSEFLNIASHELRTPISVIRGFHELMVDGTLGPVSPRQTHALEAMAHSVETLVRIAEDATRMAQIDRNHLALKRTECDLAGLVQQAAGHSRSLAAGRRVELHTRIAGNLGSGLVDGSSLVQALVNLVSNGIRFTPDGGRVDIEATRNDDGLVITVRDSGVGIEPERRGRLLERGILPRDSMHHHSSNTLEFNSAGLGMGLPIARGIIEAHGGTLELDSVPGAGTTVTVRLPLRAEPALQRA